MSTRARPHLKAKYLLDPVWTNLPTSPLSLTMAIKDKDSNHSTTSNRINISRTTFNNTILMPISIPLEATDMCHRPHPHLGLI